jgi:23S rRNA pseudouridine1911/1915/1917 synthase
VYQLVVTVNNIPTSNQPTVRLDRWLADNVEGVSRERLKQLIQAGHVLLEGQPCYKPGQLLSLGQTISLHLPKAVAIDLLPQPIGLDVVFEDEHMLVVNKPRGMLTHPAGRYQTETLVNALLHHCQGSLSGINGELRPGIVHRLDKDTSGLLMVAKTDVAHQGLSIQIQAKTAQRQYQAIVQGVFSQPQGVVDAAIGRNPKKRDAMAVVTDGGRHALTHWEVVKQVAGSAHRGLTLLKLELKTGRTHQIRVHMAHIGHPVLGDPLYGTGLEKSLHLPCYGQLLHAWRLSFTHPITGHTMSFTCPLPPEFRATLALLEAT